MQVLVFLLITMLWFITILGMLAVIVLPILMWRAHANDEKLMFGLPWLKWLTIEDVVAMGFSPMFSRLLLPMYHQEGQLEVRVRSDLSQDDVELAGEYGFIPPTVRLYEFRLTKRDGGRPRKLLSKAVRLAWCPAHA